MYDGILMRTALKGACLTVRGKKARGNEPSGSFKHGELLKKWAPLSFSGKVELHGDISNNYGQVAKLVATSVIKLVAWCNIFV